MEKLIGFIGLGIMGKPMAKNLIKGGCSLLVNDLNKEAEAELVAAGARAGTLAEIGDQCEVIFTILPNGTIVHQVLFASDGVASSIHEGALVVDLSSVTPTEAQESGRRLKEKGADFVDSPVSGGEPGAIAGTLAFMAGGSQEAYNRALPYFQIMGKSAQLIGDVGSGCVTKLANQVIVNLGIAAVSEAFVLATKAGADPEKVFNAIRGGLAGSAVLEAKVPLMIARNFKPGGKISINHKDIKNVLQTAHAIDVPMFLTSQLFEIMQSLKVGGHMEDDHGGIVQFYEELAGVQVKKP